MIMVLARSFTADGEAGITFSNYMEVLAGKGFLQALGNSLLISVCSALITDGTGFYSGLHDSLHQCGPEI